MASNLPPSQTAVALPGKRQPLTSISVPVYAPSAGEITVKVSYTASTPLDLHRADGGLAISSWPAQSGSGGAAGTIVAVGASGDLKDLKIGDKVSVFAFHGGKEANHQEYITLPAYLASKIPEGISEPAAATVNVNLVTVFHTATADLGLDLPWPVPEGYAPREADKNILIWGASSSVGVYAVQVFRHWGYKNILAVSSARHHAWLREMGATEVFDYNDARVVSSIKAYVGDKGIPFVIDCIGSLTGTLEPLKKVASRGSKVAVMLPVIVKDATDDEEPEYEMDVARCGGDEWEEGVEVRGVRTHFYEQNEMFKQILQPEILPALLAQGVIRPNRFREIQGANMVERAQNALDQLRAKAVSGERLVWRV
ncbi:hypothetical protein QQS21_003955 [Conoideocrella luteorostrata]|uniref:Enoyl reductase (ER) domain-containing protein n=1 Tax=Conoideocrella luteorostrata TaxID=1105319 RepID=A0AAJ0CS86_9HYPO|nr:hypothetical protein QQS21_003955 [Conoideocrella luteorostrata]